MQIYLLNISKMSFKCQIFSIEYKYIFIEYKNTFLLQTSNHMQQATYFFLNETLEQIFFSSFKYNSFRHKFEILAGKSEER